MENTETLKFKIGLSGSSSKKNPEFSIGISGKEYVKAKLTGGPNAIEYFEFECELAEADYTFELTLLNKLPFDTIQDENGKIIEDMLLTIESLEVDSIELGQLKWSLSTYYPKYPNSYLNENQKSVNEVKNCVNLGWNGTWQLAFKSPFYIWLLENI